MHPYSPIAMDFFVTFFAISLLILPSGAYYPYYSPPPPRPPQECPPPPLPPPPPPPPKPCPSASPPSPPPSPPPPPYVPSPRPSPPPYAPPPSDNDHNVLIIVCTSVGGPVLLASLVAALFCLKKRRRTIVEQEMEVVDMIEHVHAQETIVPGPSGPEAVVLSVDEDNEVLKEIKKTEIVEDGSNGH